MVLLLKAGGASYIEKSPMLMCVCISRQDILAGWLEDFHKTLHKTRGTSWNWWAYTYNENTQRMSSSNSLVPTDCMLKMWVNKIC